MKECTYQDIAKWSTEDIPAGVKVLDTFLCLDFDELPENQRKIKGVFHSDVFQFYRIQFNICMDNSDLFKGITCKSKEDIDKWVFYNPLNLI